MAEDPAAYETALAEWREQLEQLAANIMARTGTLERTRRHIAAAILALSRNQLYDKGNVLVSSDRQGIIVILPYPYVANLMRWLDEAKTNVVTGTASRVYGRANKSREVSIRITPRPAR